MVPLVAPLLVTLAKLTLTALAAMPASVLLTVLSIAVVTMLTGATVALTLPVLAVRDWLSVSYAQLMAPTV